MQQGFALALTADCLNYFIADRFNGGYFFNIIKNMINSVFKHLKVVYNIKRQGKFYLKIHEIIKSENLIRCKTAPEFKHNV